MDWMPIVILCLAASVVLLLRLVHSWYWAVLYFALFFALETINFNFIPAHYAVSVSYALMGITILAPLLAYLYRIRWINAGWVLLALVAFLLAITSRVLDQHGLLPMGTHFLWHLFGAVACHAMFTWFYRTPASAKQFAEP